MSIVLTLLQYGIPLHRCKEFETENDLREALGRRNDGISFSARNSRKVAQRIVNALSQRSVAEQLAKEWGALPAQLRLDVRTIANAGGYKSGNVSKGVTHLNNLLNGAILRELDDGYSERRLRVRDGVLVSEQDRIDPAKARAQALYRNTERPANYDSLSRREKKRIDRELTLARKEMRNR